MVTGPVKKFIQILEQEFLGLGVLIDALEHHRPDKYLAADVCFSFTGRDAVFGNPDLFFKLELPLSYGVLKLLFLAFVSCFTASRRLSSPASL